MSSNETSTAEPTQHAANEQRLSGVIEHLWSVDQINDEWVKLQSSDNAQLEIELPISYLPPQIREGNFVTLSLRVNLRSEEEEASAINALISDLSAEDDGGDFSL